MAERQTRSALAAKVGFTKRSRLVCFSLFIEMFRKTAHLLNFLKKSQKPQVGQSKILARTKDFLVYS